MASTHTTTKTAAAISPMMANVLAMAKNPPMAVKPTQMARIAPRTFKIIRPMLPGYPSGTAPAGGQSQGPGKVAKATPMSGSPHRADEALPLPGRAQTVVTVRAKGTGVDFAEALRSVTGNAVDPLPDEVGVIFAARTPWSCAE